MTDAIEKALDVMDSMCNGRQDSVHIRETHIRPARSELATLRARNETAEEARKDLIGVEAALRAENEAQARQIAALREAGARATTVMAECAEHGECEGADRAEMKAANRQLIDAILSVPPSSMRLVPVERLREIEWAMNDAIIRDGKGATIFVRIHRCPACHRIERPKDKDAEKIPHIEHLFGHSSDCWLAAAIAGKETPPPACDTIR